LIVKGRKAIGLRRALLGHVQPVAAVSAFEHPIRSGYTILQRHWHVRSQERSCAFGGAGLAALRMT